MFHRLTRTPMLSTATSTLALLNAALVSSCLSYEPEGLLRAIPQKTTVKYDFYALPLPEIPLPNDIATRPDPTSATGLRVNASMVAPTKFESRVRELIDELDGWGVMQPIVIPFTGPLDVQSIIDGHRDADYNTDNDVVYLIYVDPDSDELGRIHLLDLGQGNYPTTLKQRYAYGPNDPHGGTISLLYEENDEDTDGDGVLDPNEDIDLDGVLDRPNYLPGHHPAPDDLAGRASALMSFYESETNTLIGMPLVPLRERTTYAVVVTRRLKDKDGEPVGSPFEWINHLAQTESLKELPKILKDKGIRLGDVAYTFAYTTQSIESNWIPIRDGLYGYGMQKHLADEYPAEVTALMPMRDFTVYPGKKNYLMPGELWTEALALIEDNVDGSEYTQSVAGTQLIEGQGYVDYIVIGTFDSPQLYKRFDDNGKMRPLNDQSWPPDLDRKKAKAYSEKVYFTLSVPRKEVSARGDGQPAPVVILNHGHTGNRFDAMQWSAYFCRLGLAVLSIDGPSHGVGNFTEEQIALLTATVADVGVSSGVYSILDGRAVDQNGDGKKDSGVDFWTAYLFHTRDVVRQYALDLMQTIRILRTFDGNGEWNLDTDLDGKPDLAGLKGDFDGDGVVDVGGDAPILMSGGSLGGMITMVAGALEPEIDAIFPIVGGGALSTIGIRSTNGGAKVGFMVRTMSPAYAGNLEADGSMLMQTYVPDLLDDVVLPLGRMEGLAAGDSIVVTNLATGERGCGLIRPDGAFYAVLASDVEDPIRFDAYAGTSVYGGECEPMHEAVKLDDLDKLDADLEFQGKTYKAGKPILALAEGFGLMRGSPRLRRMQGLSQLVLDPGDPAVLAPHLQLEPLKYPGTGQKTGTHALFLFTAGDTSVPNSAGMAAARAAGLLPYLENDPRYGVPANQVLIDTGIAEGVSDIARHVDSNGRGVVMDVENLSNGNDIWTAIDLPRLDPPLRLGFDQTDKLGGKSGVLFVMPDPEGMHGFQEPGGMIDTVREDCRATCAETEGDDPCGCGALTTFDVGNFSVFMLGRYGASLGTEVSFDHCQSRVDCDDMPALPTPRPEAEWP